MSEAALKFRVTDTPDIRLRKLNKLLALVVAAGGGAAAWGAISGDLVDQGDLVDALNAKAPATRSILTTAPLTGGGDLSIDRTLAISAATTGAAGSMSAADKTKIDGLPGRGTSFPVSPGVGDLYTRTDRGGITYRHDASRWLSTQIFTLPINAMQTNTVYSATGSNYAGTANPWCGVYDIYVEEAFCAYFMNSTSGDWSVLIRTAQDATVTTIATFSHLTTANASRWVSSRLSGLGVTISSSVPWLIMDLTKHSVATSGCYFAPTLIYRLVG